MPMAAKIAQPWRWSPTARPNTLVSAAPIAKIETICTKFDSAVGFSNGWAALALKKPPPLVPSILMATCEATGPTAMVCSTPSSVVASDVRAERLRNTLPHQEQRKNTQMGSSNRAAAGHIHPEIPDRPGRKPRNRGSAPWRAQSLSRRKGNSGA